MRNYEVAYIADPDLDDEALQALEDRISERVRSLEGEVVDIDRWGRRRMAYEIDEKIEGFYTFVRAQMPGSGPAQLEKDMLVNENVLRFMITSIEPA